MSDPLREQIFRYAAMKRAMVLRIYEGDKLSETGAALGRVTMVITNMTCEFLNVTRKKVVTNECHSWFDIAKIAFSNQNVVTIGFKNGEMRFRSPKSHAVAVIATKYVQRILTPAERAHVSFPPLNGHPVEPNESSIMFRMFNYFHAAKLSMDSPALSNIVGALRIRSRRIDKLEFGAESDRALPIFFDCLSMKNRVRQLGFTGNNGNNLMACVASHMGCLKEIRQFTFCDPPTREFTQAVLKTETKLRGLTFEGVEFGDQQVAVVGTLVQACKLNSLGFRGGIDSETAYMIAAMRDFKNMRLLEFNGIQGLNMPRILPLMRNLHVLNVANCGLVIGDFLKQAAKADLANLKSVNLSGNIGKDISSSQKLTQSLIKIHANDVQWEANSLIAFMKICNASPNIVCLSVARADIDGRKWGVVNKALAQLKGRTLEILTWDGNSITNEFLTFVGAQSSLDYLSLCHCITRETLGLLVKFFQKKRSVRQLNLKGFTKAEYEKYVSKQGSDKVLLPDIKQLFEVLEKHQEITAIDASYNLLDDNTCDVLAQWAMRSQTLKFIAFDGTSASSLDVIVRCCTILEMRQTGIFFSYPAMDIARLEAAERQSRAVVERLKHRFLNVRKNKEERKAFPKIPKPFKRPFDVYYGDIDEKFIEYIPERGDHQPVIEVTRRVGATLAPVSAPSEAPSPPEEEPPEEGSEADYYYSDADEEEDEEPVALSETPAVQDKDFEAMSTASTAMETEQSVVKPPPTKKTQARTASLQRSKKVVQPDESEITESSATMGEEVPEKVVTQHVPNRVSPVRKVAAQTYRPKSPAQSPKPVTPMVATAVFPSSKTRTTPFGRSPMRTVSPKPCVKWAFPIRFAPEIDNSIEVERLEAEFSIENLLAEMRKVPQVP